MGVRESLNKNKGAAAAVFVGTLAVAGGLAYLISRPGGEEAAVQSRVFYTADDGKTWFPDDVAKLYPFDHNGKPAYRVQVYKCGDGGQPFAGYLQRIDDAAIKNAKAAQAANKPWEEIAAIVEPKVEVKKPADAGWVSVRSAQAEVVTTVPCPDGKSPLVQLP